MRSTTDVGGGFLTSEHRLHPGKEGVPPCPITDGQHITPRNPVQSGQRLPQSSDSAPERQGFPPVQSEGDRYHPTKPCPIRAKITSEDRSPHPARGRDKNRRAPLSARWSWVGIVGEERGRHCSWCASLVVVVAVSQAGPLTIPQPSTSISHFVEQ